MPLKVLPSPVRCDLIPKRGIKSRNSSQLGAFPDIREYRAPLPAGRHAPLTKLTFLLG